METLPNKEEKQSSSKLDELKAKVLSENKPNIKVLIAKVTDHIASVKSEVLKYAGKPGHNPYVWLKINNFNLAENIIKSPASFDEVTVTTILTKVLNTNAEPPVVGNPLIPSARQVNKLNI